MPSTIAEPGNDDGRLVEDDDGPFGDGSEP